MTSTVLYCAIIYCLMILYFYDSYAYRNPLRARFNLSEQDQVTVLSAYEPFVATSTIHGLRHISDRQNGFISKCFWSIWVLFSFLICVILLSNVLSRWSDDPLIVSLTDKPEPVWEIPFPAVTICPETKTKTSIFNFTEYYQMSIKGKLDSLIKDPNRIETLRTIRAVSQICDSHLMFQFLQGAPYVDSNIYDDLRRIAPSFNETAFMCQFRDELTQCHQFFSEVWTEEGLCFSFNLLNGNDITSELVDIPKYPLVKRVQSNIYSKRVWTLDKGYQRNNEIDPKVYPFEIVGAGNRGAFTIVLRMFENDYDYVCRGPIIGYKIAIHLPGDLPQIASNFIRIPTKQETLITFDPNVMRTASSLRRYSPNARGCYYPNEGTLKYFKEYTQRNCELECLTDYTLRNCGCVKFSMPRDDSTPICGYGKFMCVVNSVKSMLGEKLKNVTNGIEDSCNCLPTCTQISYNHEISHASLNFLKLIESFEATSSELNDSVTYTRLTIQAKENYFIATRRHELYSNADLLALCGGIASLFFGASLCSILEIFYYLASYFLKWKKSSSIERHILKDDFDNDNVLS